MPRGKKSAAKPKKRPIERYEHKDKTRINNPPVGLVTAETDPPLPTHRVYDYIQPVPTVRPGKDLDYDPHLDPQLVWAGKKEHSSFEVPTVSLHVHETIDPRTIMEAVRRRNGNGLPAQPSLFERPEEKLPLRDAIDFYKHSHGWSNRLIAGDSLLVMNSLLEKEGMAGQVQMAYIDPPYGIKYGSNFQPFVDKRDVKDGRDEDLTQEPEMIQAFRDTWELGIHSYLTYLRDRLLLAKELLHESGSLFLQISNENLHHAREMLEEVFGRANFCGLIVFAKSSATTSETLPTPFDYLLWFAKDHSKLKFHQLFHVKRVGGAGGTEYNKVLLPDRSKRRLNEEEIANLSLLPSGSKVYRLSSLVSQGFRQFTSVPFRYEGSTFDPGPNMNWKTTLDGLRRLASANRVEAQANSIAYVRFYDDFPVFSLNNVWGDTGIAGRPGDKIYVVQTSPKIIERCILMTTDPGDLVLDPTCGSGTTADVAEEWGRRWITCDTSRVATTLAKQRLMTAEFDYYELAHSDEGVGSGFRYKTVPHVTLKSIANNPEIREGMSREQIEAAIAKYADQETRPASG
jgi:adenine-specific DNA-methyltransferase